MRTLASWILLALALPVWGETLEGKVVGISDGDTLTLLDSANTQHKIRLSGIDTPEKAQAFGNRAKQAVFVTLAGDGSAMVMRVGG
jgi:endonuclease YncB( thermonuclease family)